MNRHYGITHVFTGRTEDERINLKAGPNETLVLNGSLAPVGFAVEVTGTDVTISNGNITAWNVTRFDSNNSFSGGTYTIPVTGLYHLSLNCLFAISSGQPYEFSIINGSGVRIVSDRTQVNSSNVLNVHSVSGVVYLTQGSTITAYNSSPYTTYLNYDTTGYTCKSSFSGYLVGVV